MAPMLDDGYRLLAAKYVREQIGRLAEQLDGVRRADDIEHIHRARVASRRLRAATRMFGDCFQAGSVRRWRKHIRRVTDGLGNARDLDVQIELLYDVLDRMRQKACYPGLARLAAKLERRRERVQPAVIKATDRLQASGVIDEIRAAAEQISGDARAAGADVRSPAARAETRRHILQNLQRMMQLRDCLDDPEDGRGHHELRIASKRLRYTMEISKPVHGGRLDEPVIVAKRLQSLLGVIHDCDEWVRQLDKFAAGLRKRIVKRYGHAGPVARFQVGVDHLRQQRAARRRQVFGELLDFWHELDREKHWDRLAAAVQTPAQPHHSPQGARS